VNDFLALVHSGILFRVIISLVAAAAENNVIGDSKAPNHSIPWHLPNDFKHFREVTDGKPVIMGRKTMETIGRLLPGRINIVITRSEAVPFDGAVRAASLEEAIEVAKREKPNEICIIGGGEIFKQGMEIADAIHFTRVHETIDGDTFFPKISPEIWELVSSQRHEADSDHKQAYTFEEYRRVKK